MRRKSDPVSEAVLGRNQLSLEQALREGNPVETRDRDGRTPLLNAVIDGSTDLVTILIRAGCDLSAADKHGFTAVHFAARCHSESILALLLNAGAKVDPIDAHGNTPLNTEVFESRGRGEIIRLLLAADADPELRNKYGVSPRILAETIANFDVRSHLPAPPNSDG